MPVAALVLGILSTICSLTVLLWPVGVALGVVALILGIVGRKSAAANNQPTGLATAGLALGGVGLALGILLFVSCAACVGMSNPELQRQMQRSIEEQRRLQEAQEKAAGTIPTPGSLPSAAPSPAPAAPARQ
ncbi:MAG TPA: DUF4190 domain-containing protein [Polyangia bacterium]|jgi:hypothetical protein|nr:DUF4190 domain-containing protein [Polyangia bacterium]